MRGALTSVSGRPYRAEQATAKPRVVVVILGSLVGWERERRDRPAGLRTHILACVGAALVTLGAVVALLVFFTLTVVNRLEDTYITRRMYESLRLITKLDRDVAARVLL